MSAAASGRHAERGGATDSKSEPTIRKPSKIASIQERNASAAFYPREEKVAIFSDAASTGTSLHAERGASHAPSSEGKSQQSKPLVAVLAGFELAIARKLPLFLRPVVKASSVPAELRFDARRDLPDLGAGSADFEMSYTERAESTLDVLVRSGGPSIDFLLFIKVANCDAKDSNDKWI